MQHHLHNATMISRMMKAIFLPLLPIDLAGFEELGRIAFYGSGA